MSQEVSSEQIEKTKLNQETSLMPWSELQRHFAGGLVLRVDSSLDLIDTAYQISVDNKDQIAQWLDQQVVAQVTDEQAGQWFEVQAELWTVVVRPWVLVQEIRPGNKYNH